MKFVDSRGFSCEALNFRSVDIVNEICFLIDLVDSLIRQLGGEFPHVIL